MNDNRRPDIGRADLLRYFEVERNPKQRAQAMARLGIAMIDAVASVAGRKLRERPDDDSKHHVDAEQTSRTRALLPAFLHASFWTEPVEDLSEEDTVLDWAKDSGHVLATMQRPKKARPPAPQPLMPVSHVVRRLIDWAGDAGQVEVDLRALRHRLTRAQPLLPLPVHAPTQLPGRWVVVVDRDSALLTYAADFAAITKGLTSVLGRQRLHVEYLEQGRTDEQWRQLARAPGQEHVVWVVLSDLGLGDDERRRQWERRLRLRAQKGLRTLAVLPCLRSEASAVLMRGVQCLALAGSGSRSAESEQAQIDRLLMALSPFLTIDPYLIRAMRQALCPGSSPLLEQKVWRHADLDSAVLDCKWKPGRQSHALSQLRDHIQSAGNDFARLIWRHMQPQRPWVSASHHHIQCLLLSHQIDFKGSSTPDLEGLQSERIAAAEWLGMAAPFLLGVETANLSAGSTTSESSNLTCAAMATGLLLRMPVPMRMKLGAQAEMLDASSRVMALSRGEQTPVPEGVDDRLLRSLLARSAPAVTFEAALVQRGTALWLEAVNTRSATLGGITLATGRIRTGLVTLAKGTLREQLMVTVQNLPIVLDHVSAIGADTPLRFTWPGGGLAVTTLRRPRGVLGWRQSPEGLEVMTPTLRGPTIIAPHDVLLPNATEGASRGARSSNAEVALNTRSFSSAADDNNVMFGVDNSGAYLDIRFSNAPNGEATQRFRYIEPGTFTMGSPQAERVKLAVNTRMHDWANQSESPPHRVTLTQGYWLANTPCTKGVWQAVMGYALSNLHGIDASMTSLVENVSWDRAQAFLDAVQKNLPNEWVAALPTEAQWEYAAKAGTQTAYWWGDDPDTSKMARHVTSGVTPWTEARNQVARYEANPWGLYDVHGNVWEWCEGSLRQYRSRSEIDPQDAQHEARFPMRAMRGGSVFYPAGHARSTYRRDGHLGIVWPDRGFRLALRPFNSGPEGKPMFTPAAGGPRASAKLRDVVKSFEVSTSRNGVQPPRKVRKGRP